MHRFSAFLQLHKKKFATRTAFALLFGALLFSGCGDSGQSNPGGSGGTGTPTQQSSGGSSSSSKKNNEKLEQQASQSLLEKFGEIQNPSAPGTTVIGNESVTIDISNATEGYYQVSYHGSNPKVKLQVLGPDQIKYTYNIKNEPVYLPFSGGNGEYQFALYEQVVDTQYSTAFKDSIQVEVRNEFLPFLYPNMYVNFTDTTRAISLSRDLTANCGSDLEIVSTVYHYITDNITYDKEEAQTVAYDYLPDVDEVLATKKGICFDYASLMASMLRCHSIPTRLQVGYAGEAYHAWISTYIEDVGWIDGIVQFHGDTWSLMDPTFAANGKNSSTVKEFIGDGTNYKTLYTY